MKTHFIKPILVIVSMILTFSLGGCDKDDDLETIISMTVASEMKMGKLYWMSYDMNCYQVKEENSSEWKLFDPRNLKGFDYEEGYEYVIKVKKTRVQNPAQDDGPEYTYQFIEVVSKEKKDSF